MSLMMTLTTHLKPLYEIDDYQWLQETIEILKANELDLESLIEELEDLGSSTGGQARGHCPY